ncbi:MAG: hypothetical protein ABJK11_14885 [Balneola sp.]
MNLHQFRFASFLKFLKENNAEIKIPDLGVVYFAKNAKDQPSLKSLLIESLDLTESQASELISRKPVLSDVQTNKKSIRGIGKFIDAIHFYYDSDGTIISSTNKHKHSNPFGIRLEEDIYAPREIQRDEYLFHTYSNGNLTPIYDCWDYLVFPKLYKGLMEGLKEYVWRMSRMFPMFATVNSPNYSFSKELIKLCDIYGEHVLHGGKTENNLLAKKVDRFLDVINSYSRSEKRDQGLFYRCIDGYLVTRKEVSLSSFKKNISSESNWREIIDLDEFELLKYRYELIWKLVDEKTPVAEWPLDFHALLVLTFFEFDITQTTVEKELVPQLIKELRFNLFSSENSSGMNYQRHDLNLDELSVVLSKYNFLHGFVKSFDINDENILVKRLIKYPEPGTVKTSTNKETIEEFLKAMFKKYFHEKIMSDLNMLNYTVPKY